MKSTIATLVTVAALVTLTCGCESLITKQEPATDLPAQLGLATTNDTQLVAYLRAAQTANAAVNPTPTEPLVNQLLGTLILLAGAAAGFFGHRSASSSGAAIANTKNANPDQKP